MKRTVVIAVAAWASLTACSVLTPSRLAAEPILGDEGIAVPEEVPAQKLDAADAIALFKAGDYDGSLKLWEEAVKKNPDLPPAQVIMAQLYLRSNMLKEAMAALDKATADAPGDPEAYITQANLAMLVARDLNKADALCQKANQLLAAFSKSEKRKQVLQPQVYRVMAGVAEARKDWAGAEKALEAWLKLDPKNVPAMQRIAFCRFHKKDIDGALAELREAAKIDTTMLTPEAAIAQAYYKMGDLENTKKWMTTAVEVDPDNMKTRLAAGQWALETGQLEVARKHSLAAVRLDPKAQRTKFFRGAIAMFEKDYEAAETYFDLAIKQAPNDFGTRNNLAVALIEQPDDARHRRALELAEANVKQFPKATEAHSTYAWVLYRLGRLDDAEKAIRGAESAARTDVDVAYIMARIAIDRGHKVEAKELLGTALKTTAPALFRPEAESLLKKLSK
jgi:tetratricopeptide (TPR) repeat protein